jgi:hypothetical protein
MKDRRARDVTKHMFAFFSAPALPALRSSLCGCRDQSVRERCTKKETQQEEPMDDGDASRKEGPVVSARHSQQ